MLQHIRYNAFHTYSFHLYLKLQHWKLPTIHKFIYILFIYFNQFYNQYCAEKRSQSYMQGFHSTALDKQRRTSKRTETSNVENLCMWPVRLNTIFPQKVGNHLPEHTTSKPRSPQPNRHQSERLTMFHTRQTAELVQWLLQFPSTALHYIAHKTSNIWICWF